MMNEQQQQIVVASLVVPHFLSAHVHGHGHDHDHRRLSDQHVCGWYAHPSFAFVCHHACH